MSPAHSAVCIYEEVSPIREETVLVEHAVEVRDLALEVAEEINLQVVLLLVFLQRVSRIDADREHRESSRGEVVPVVAHLAELGRTRWREGERKEGDQDLLPSQL